MSNEGRFHRIMRGLPAEPEIQKELKERGEPVGARQLQKGDWSVGHQAFVFDTETVEQGQKVEVTFFENSPKPVRIDRDDELEVIRGLQGG